MKYIIQTDIDCLACFDDTIVWLLELQTDNKISWLAYIELDNIYIIFLESELIETDIMDNINQNLWCDYNIYISKAINKIYNHFYQNAIIVQKNWMF